MQWNLEILYIIPQRKYKGVTEISQQNKRRKYIVDSIASIVFWVPIYLMFNFFILHLEIWQVFVLAGFSAAVNFVFGGLFGRFLDWWRKKLTNHY